MSRLRVFGKLFSVALLCLATALIGRADAAVRVSSTAELLDAIKPGAHIIVEPGSYRMSFAIDPAIGNEKATWQDNNPYVTLEEVYDGLMIKIAGVDNLTIEGDGDGAELLIQPRYATVFSFTNCNKIALNKLTLGHEGEGGTCFGNVVDFSGCGDIKITDCDLFGCGDVGIYAQFCRDNITVKDTVIRDCASGPYNISDCTGAIEFHDCRIIGSKGVGFIQANGAAVGFFGCEFGARESELHLFPSKVIWKNCKFSEVKNIEYGM